MFSLPQRIHLPLDRSALAAPQESNQEPDNAGLSVDVCGGVLPPYRPPSCTGKPIAPCPDRGGLHPCGREPLAKAGGGQEAGDRPRNDEGWLVVSPGSLE